MAIKQYFKKVKFSGFPIGRIFSKISTLANDDLTLSGLEQARELIEKDKEGLSVFFAHLGLLDVFGTAIAFEKYINYKGIFPVAATWYNFPYLKPIFISLAKQVPHEFIPVFRKEEMGYSDLNVTFVDYSGLDSNGKKIANKKYVERTKKALDDGRVVMLSPYGGRAPKLEFLRSGPVRMLQAGNPVIFSLTYWNWKKFKYEVFFSNVYRFDKNVDKQAAHKQIFAEYYRMAKLNGLTKIQITNVKSGKGLLTKIWEVVYPIF